MSLGGRPKEEGGHHDWHLTFNAITNKALEKVKGGDGDVSKFIEREIKSVVEKMDPGDVSIHLYRYEVYLAQQIINETGKGNFESAKAIASIASAIQEYMTLSGIPPSNFKFQENIGEQYSINQQRWILLDEAWRDGDKLKADRILISILKSLTSAQWTKHLDELCIERKTRQSRDPYEIVLFSYPPYTNRESVLMMIPDFIAELQRILFLENS